MRDINTGIIIIGAGGHASSVIDAATSANIEIIGFVDERKTGKVFDLPIFGPTLDSVPQCKNWLYHIAIGDCKNRKRWYELVKSHELPLVNIIDPSAIVSSMAKIGEGNFIGKLAIVNSMTCIGDNNIINTNSLVEHGCRVGNHVNLSTSSTLNGDVIVEDCVFFGSSAVCNGQLRLGEYSTVGAGSVVIRDVEPRDIVVGAPARSIRKDI